MKKLFLNLMPPSSFFNLCYVYCLQAKDIPPTFQIKLIFLQIVKSLFEHANLRLLLQGAPKKFIEVDLLLYKHISPSIMLA